MLKGKTAVVTGASRGIGRAIALIFAENGANVVINYCGNEAKARETKELCEKYGVKAIIAAADVKNGTDCEKLACTAMEEFGRIDILVNNAGITRDNLIMRMSQKDWEDVLSTNLKGAFLTIQKVSRIMMKQKFGRIVNISSVVGLKGNAGQSNYSAAKAGLIGLTKSCAKELSSRNITVNAVAPGFIVTDMTDNLSDEVKGKINSLVNYMESFPDDFSIYMTSQEYKTNHYERIQNDKDSPAFVFNG